MSFMKPLTVIAIALACAGCVVRAGRQAPGTEDDNGASADVRPDDHQEALKLSDLEEQVSAARNDSSAPTAKLQALGRARSTLLERRAAVVLELMAKDREAMSKDREEAIADDPRLKDVPDDVWEQQWRRTWVEPLGERGLSLLRKIHHGRAANWVREGKPLEALRELTYGHRADDGWMPLLSCGKTEPDCQMARTEILKTWPGLCQVKEGYDFTSCRVLEEYQLPAGAELGRLPALARFVVTSGANNLGATTVIGANYPAKWGELCKGRFETDRILDVNEERIRIERTTWCQSIEKQREKGQTAHYHLPQLPVSPVRGSEVLLLVGAGQVQSKTRGDMQRIDVKGAKVVYLKGGKSDSYLFNERIPSALLREEPPYDLASSP